MKTIKTIAFLLTLCPAVLTAQSPSLLTPSKLTALDSLLQAQFKDREPGAVVLLAQNGVPVFQKAFGMASIELDVPMRTDHKLALGSVSKQFAAIAILMLQQEGRLNLADDIRKYLPLYDTHGRVITIEQLLVHSSGIPEPLPNSAFDTLGKRNMLAAQLPGFFQDRELLFEPGTDFSYSNSGYQLAALIVERVAGMPYQEFLQKRMFDPLAMKETAFGSSEFVVPNKTGEYGPVTPLGRGTLESSYNWSWSYGSGQILTTVADMLKWDEGLYGSALVPREVVVQAHRSRLLPNGQPTNYGLGWITGSIGGKTLVFHTGTFRGYRAIAMRVPEDHLYLILLSNSASTNSLLTGHRMLSLLYDIPELREVKEPVAGWKDIQGVYASPTNHLRLQSNFGPKKASYSVWLDSKEAIHALREGGEIVYLAVAGKDVYFDRKNPFMRWKLERDARGEVLGLRFEPYFPAAGPARLNSKISASVPALPPFLPFDAPTLRRLPGVYEDASGYRIKIGTDQDEVMLTYLANGYMEELHWAGENRIYSTWNNRKLDLDPERPGVATTLRYFNGVSEMVFRRVVEGY